MEKMIITGAGLCGTMLAIRLAQKGYEVELYERRPDLRKQVLDAGRSINLALSDRGLHALDMVGLRDVVQPLMIPMYGRMIHAQNGETWLSRYSGREQDFINSISRPGLNKILLDKADTYPNIRTFFRHQCTGVALKEKEIFFLNRETGEDAIASGDMLFGTDGAGSAVRKSMMGSSTQLSFEYKQEFLSHGYKELTIPAGPSGEWQLDKNALHIWPRQEFMLIALPNLDGSFTVTLFLSFDGHTSFSVLNTSEEVEAFFKAQFPDACALMPNLAGEFFEHPTPTLGTIRCFPWSAYGNALLLGDAAHAVVPFYGQGMNCALEDIVELDKDIDKYPGDWEQICHSFENRRKPQADAIADLALANYYEMRDHVDDENFILKRKIEMELEKRYPDYHSKYSLVTFKEEIPYDLAKRQGDRQDAFLLEYVKGISGISDVKIDALHEELMALS